LDFSRKCQPFWGKPLTVEENTQITELFNEFCQLLKNTESRKSK